LTCHAHQATAQLNTEYYKNPACISALAQILASSPEIAVSKHHIGVFWLFLIGIYYVRVNVCLSGSPTGCSRDAEACFSKEW
jgi:hypothetical protein